MVREVTSRKGLRVFGMRTSPFPVALCLIFLLSACGKSTPNEPTAEGRPVMLATVQPWDAREVREFFGRVEPTGISTLAFEVPGRVVEIAVRDGADVKKGQLIARLDTEPYELVLRRADVQARQLAADLTRKRQLRDDRILAQGAFEQLEAAAEMAKVQAELARRDLRNTRLIAPFDGRISMRTIEVQQQVAAGTPVFRLENVNRLDIGVDLPQNLAQSLTFDKSLTAVAWLPERPEPQIALTYREHATQSVPATGVYRLIFNGERPANVSLLAGMAMRVRLVQAAPEGSSTTVRFVVPMSAVDIRSEGVNELWRWNSADGNVRAVRVKLIKLVGDNAIVEGELKAGDKVVSSGTRALSDGMKVTAMGGK